MKFFSLRLQKLGTLSLLLITFSFSMAAKTDSLVLLQMRAGYFYPASPVMRGIYHHGGAELEVEAGLYVYRNLNAWVNFNYFHRHGRSFGLCSNTTLNMYPLSFGLKYDIPVTDWCALYLGAGASCSFIGMHEKSPFAFHRSRQSNTRWGAVGKSGLLFQLTDHLFMDVFADGYYTRAHLIGNIHNVGGLRTGVGLGVNF